MTRITFAATLAVVGALSSDHGFSDGSVVLCKPDSMRWVDGPPSLLAGAKVAVLEGDMSKPGPFVARAKMPDGYRVPPHTHPKAERLTILKGTFLLGMGETFDESKMETLPAGSYGIRAAGMKHFAMVKGETIIQIHGDGPWSIDYLNLADDPRNKK